MSAPFAGFPEGSRTTGIPNTFFTEVLPFIDDLAELKVTLHLLWKLSWKVQSKSLVTLRELRGDLDLLSGLTSLGDPAEALSKGLQLAVERGTFLHLAVGEKPARQELYVLNSDGGQNLLEQARRGKIDLGGLPQPEALPANGKRPNIFTLYEENIGVLTPLLADELKEAENLYPYPWIVEAFKEAVRLNHRSWRYIERILENWKTEGRHGIAERTFETVQGGGAARKRGGHIVKRRRE